MSRIDGTSEVEKTETEVVPPEKCENVEDFEKSTDERADQLREGVEKDPDANKYVDGLAADHSTEDILKMKEDAGDPNETREAFQDACFGEHEGMSDEDRAEMIENAKGDWENSVIDNHMCDMALERQGYDPSETGGGAETGEEGASLESVETPDLSEMPEIGEGEEMPTVETSDAPQEDAPEDGTSEKGEFGEAFKGAFDEMMKGFAGDLGDMDETGDKGAVDGILTGLAGDIGEWGDEE